MKFLFGFIVILSLIIFLVYYGFNISYTPPPVTEITRQCLDKLDIKEITWETAVFVSTDETDVAVNFVWDVFSDLKNWSSWSSPLHRSADWTKGKEFISGNQFKEALNLGFPLKDREAVETIFLAEKEKWAVWHDNINEIKSCHGWQFIKMQNGHTKIINTMVYNGRSVGLARPFIISPWQSMLDEDIRGLIRKSINN